jgi:hypothetical protein
MVTDAAVAGRAAGVVAVATRGAGECGREGSSNDMDGKDDVGEEKTFSHGGESDGSPVLACRPADGARRVGSAFEAVGRGRFCYMYVPQGDDIKRARKSSKYTSSVRKTKGQGGGRGKERKEKRREDVTCAWVDSCEREGALSPTPTLASGPVSVVLGTSTLVLCCVVPTDTASHSLVVVLTLSALALTFVSGRGTTCLCLCLCSACCSSRSRARRTSHRARSASARARASALCRRHSIVWASSSAFHASCSAAETEMEAEGEEGEGEDDSVALAAGGAESEGGWASDDGVSDGGGGGDCGCERETRGRSGGTENRSESAALIGKWLGRARGFGGQ